MTFDPSLLVLVAVGGIGYYAWDKNRKNAAPGAAEAAAQVSAVTLPATTIVAAPVAPLATDAKIAAAPIQVSMLASDDALAFEYFSRIEKRYDLKSRLDAEQYYLDLQNGELQKRKAAITSPEKKTP